jgi:hypothetical protein
MRVRLALKRLLMRWLSARKLHTINDVDLVTCDIPKQPVHLIYWPTRSQYVFEARTLHKDMVERLLHHNDLWIHPLPPRNPFTNMNMSVCEMHACITMCRKHGISHWATEALRTCQYNLTTFQRNYTVPLKMSALRRMFQNTERLSEEAKDFLVDFIEQEHDHFQIPFREYVYRWALNTIPRNRIIQEWIRACKLFYEIHITTPEAGEIELKQLTTVNPITRNLCATIDTLISARNLWHKQKLLRAAHAKSGSEGATSA